MKLKKYVIANVQTFVGEIVMLLSKEEYQLSCCLSEVIRTTDDFDEATRIYKELKN